jgi:hypothetical protein
MEDVVLKSQAQTKGMWQAAETLAAHARPTVEFWAAGDDLVSRFAVCGPRGVVLWRDTVDRDPTLHPAWRFGSADTVAASKAIWLAGRVRAELDVASLRLLLHVANPNVNRDALEFAAIKAGVVLDIDVGAANPALDTVAAGSRADWRHLCLPALASMGK